MSVSDTKRKIIREARTLFAERGYNGTTTAEIARHVGVSEAALYKHYKGKKEIFLACVTPNVQDKLEWSISDSPELLKDVLKARVELVRRNLESFNIFFKESPNHPELARMFLEQVYTHEQTTEFLLKRFLKEELSPIQSLLYELGITSAIWAILNFEKLQEELITEKTPIDNLADEMADFVLNGISGKIKNSLMPKDKPTVLREEKTYG